MDSTAFLALLADAATSPTMLLIAALIVFVAGVACGSLARMAALPDAIADDEAGDTHAQFQFCRCELRPIGTSGRLQQVDSSDCPLHRLRKPITPAARRGT